MKQKLTNITKIISLLVIIGTVLVILLPIWKIELTAPQYPEGLEMKIHANKVTGDVEIINGLNNYIGMKEIHQDDFKEFEFLPYLLAGIAVLGLISLLINRRWMFFTWSIVFFLFALAAMADFYLWLQDYGHNLDPHAPIKVPGMSYSPPLLGFKQLLNFGAYSIPAQGGWSMILSGVILLAAFIYEFLLMRKQQAIKALMISIPVITLAGLMSCSSGPRPIHFGTDNCDLCVMTIVDERFGAELLTKKGKAYKFDDLHCLKEYINQGNVKEADIGELFVIDYANPTELIKLSEAFILQGGEIQSPMASQTAAFFQADSLEHYKNYFNAEIVLWENIINQPSSFQTEN
ncbi:MAG TPA: nitrous oxide reductase accessory protein NosL [Candidatus Sphingobacterium stercoripullorum]|nr:nitrous oxide reductase accessory protein NosL [Candidatus Sphingobacterium stercoripullorum]